MNADFAASAVSAGSLISTTTFEIPPFQREYAWEESEYEEFWDDVSRSLLDDSYFLGLIILTGVGSDRKQVVDGQQRLLTVTLLACAIHREARAIGRTALADRIEADFLCAIDYKTDAITTRIVLADSVDNAGLHTIIEGRPIEPEMLTQEAPGISTRLYRAFSYLSAKLHADLAQDPFKRLGIWASFLTYKLEFAVFVHPDPGSAYRVFEVINTRGREPTTADLLKNYLLSQTTADRREAQYERWQQISRSFVPTGPNNLVQYIRHVVTVTAGHIPPKELFDYLARRKRREPAPPSVEQLLDMLERHLPLYLQMVDPTTDGPASQAMLSVFGALNELNVIVVRPLLLAIHDTSDPADGMKRVLDLVVRRMVVGYLGTGNVERRFGEAALAVHGAHRWTAALEALRDLDPPRDDFVFQLSKRSLNKGVLGFVRRSIVQGTRTPESVGWLHYIWPRQGADWGGFSETTWGATIGNTFLVRQERRPAGAGSWDGALRNLLPLAVEGEWVDRLSAHDNWDIKAVEETGGQLADAGGDIWY